MSFFWCQRCQWCQWQKSWKKFMPFLWCQWCQQSQRQKSWKKNPCLFSDVNGVNSVIGKTSSTTRVRLGQSMLDNILFSIHIFFLMSMVSTAKKWKKKSCLFSDVYSVNGKTSSTTQVRLGQSMLDNIFFSIHVFFLTSMVSTAKKMKKKTMSFFWCQWRQWQN